MRTKQIFISFDDKEFNTEEECISYEKFVKEELPNIIPTIKKIKEFCLSEKVCSTTCRFYNNYSECCIFKKGFPTKWDLDRVGD